MSKFIYFIFFTIFLIHITEDINAKENFFADAKKKYDNKKYEESKFLFQRNIVFNPKNESSYLYLAKIYKIQENIEELKKNLDTTLLLDSKNEEALFMLIELEIERSNFSKVKELNEKFSIVCLKLCDKKKIIDEKVKNIEVKNDSKQ